MIRAPRAVLFAFLALAAALSAAPAGAGPWSLAPGEHYSEIRSSLYTADRYHDRDGEQPQLLGGGLLTERTLTFHNELGWKKWASVFIDFPISSVTRRTGDGRFQRTETGFSDIDFGLHFNILNGPTALSYEQGWRLPAGYRSDTLGTNAEFGRYLGSYRRDSVGALYAPRLGDGLGETHGAVHLGSALGTLGFLQAAVGYRDRYRTINELGEIFLTAGADLGLWVTPSLMIGGRYQGDFSVKKGDPRRDSTEVQRAGVVVVYRVDDRLDLIAGSFSTAAAKNSPHFDQAYVGIAFKQSRLRRTQGFLGSKQR